MTKTTDVRQAPGTKTGPFATRQPGRTPGRVARCGKCGFGWVAGLVLSTGLAWADHPPPPAGTKPKMAAVAVDLPRFMGQWYQVALYPNKFQAQCVKDTTATYRLLPEGSVEVTNACRLQSGEMTRVVGEARYQDEAPSGGPRPAKLEVRFAPRWLSWLPMVWGDYWVLDIASDYRWAVVSEPQRQFLWVLSRTPTLAEADDATIRRFLQTQGFELARLQAHSHNGASGAATATPPANNTVPTAANSAASALSR